MFILWYIVIQSQIINQRVTLIKHIPFCISVMDIVPFFHIKLNADVIFCLLGQLSVGDDSSSSGDTSSSSSQSAQSPQQQPSSNLPVTANTGHSISPEQQRRSFYLRLSQRAVSRSEITQYELVHVLGLLRVPQRPNRGPSTHSRTRSRSRGICCCY